MLAPQDSNPSGSRRPRIATEAMAEGIEQQLRTKVRRLGAWQVAGHLPGP